MPYHLSFSSSGAVQYPQEEVTGWRPRRSLAIAQAMSSLPLACAVEARDGQYGGGVFVTRTCEEGEVLLSIPLAACITSEDIPSSHPVMSRVGPSVGDNFGRSVIAMLLAMESKGDCESERDVQVGKESERTGKKAAPQLREGARQCAEYMRAVAPDFMLQWLVMAGWPEDSLPAAAVRGTVAWARAKAHQRAMLAEAAAVGECGECLECAKHTCSPSLLLFPPLPCMLCNER